MVMLTFWRALTTVAAAPSAARAAAHAAAAEVASALAFVGADGRVSIVGDEILHPGHNSG